MRHVIGVKEDQTERRVVEIGSGRRWKVRAGKMAWLGFRPAARGDGGGVAGPFIPKQLSSTNHTIFSIFFQSSEKE